MLVKSLAGDSAYSKQSINGPATAIIIDINKVVNICNPALALGPGWRLRETQRHPPPPPPPHWRGLGPHHFLPACPPLPTKPTQSGVWAQPSPPPAHCPPCLLTLMIHPAPQAIVVPIRNPFFRFPLLSQKPLGPCPCSWHKRGGGLGGPGWGKKSLFALYPKPGTRGSWGTEGGDGRGTKEESRNQEGSSLDLN